MRICKLGLTGLLLILFLTGCGNPAQEASSSVENDAQEETQQETGEEEESGSGIEMTSWRESVQIRMRRKAIGRSYSRLWRMKPD